MNLKAITSDIDGTLINDNEELTDKTRKILLEAQRKGIKLFLASGRNEPEMLYYANLLEMGKYGGVLISSNGSFAKNIETGQVYFDMELSIDDSNRILKDVDKFDIYPMIFIEDKLYCKNIESRIINREGWEYNIVEYEASLGNYEIIECENLMDIIDRPIKKILTAGNKEYLLEIHDRISEPLVDDYTCQFTGDVYFEIIQKGANKGEAMKASLEKMGIDPKDTIAFGDHNNDQQMLEYAGLGVAMENATDLLKEASDFVGKSNNEDGIYEILKKYI